MLLRKNLRLILLCGVLASACDDSEADPRQNSPDAASSADASGGGPEAGSSDAASASDGGGVDGSANRDAGGGGDTGTNTDASADGGTANGEDAAVLATGSGAWTVYPDPYGDGGANPAMGIQGSALATRAGDGGMTVTLSVSGLPALRGFGSHVHKLSCAEEKAGGHFQHVPPADGGSATDPNYANPANEVWLDFTTSDAGSASASASVGWIPAPSAAKAIIVHDRRSGDGGVAGAKLACLPFAF